MKEAMVVLSSVLLLAGCERRTNSDNPAQPTTQTIAPAAAKPAPPGTEAITQTVDIEDSRSEAEGGVVTKPATTTAKTAPAKKKSKK